MRNLLSRINGKWRRTLAGRFGRRMIPMPPGMPLISFSFDDAPKTAFKTGGAILDAYGAKATYYMSLGLLGQETEVGEIAAPEDLIQAVCEGHELGCHTYDHLDAWYTPKNAYMESVAKNFKALREMKPDVKFESFAYPKSGATLSIKYDLEKIFLCCRGGGQTPNVKRFDLNLVNAYFIDSRLNLDIDTIKNVIDYNALHKGWLIFVTHDISEKPSPYGCTPGLLQQVVEYSAQSGALLLPVAKACKRLIEHNNGVRS